MAIRAGRLRHYISVERETTTTDEGGGRTLTWSAVENGERWASIDPASAREIERHQQLQQAITHRVRMRWLPNITTKNRILFGERIFDIRSVITMREIQHEMILLVEEREVGDGRDQ